jgi:hypothetical protein
VSSGWRTVGRAEKLQASSPGLFNSGYFVLAAAAGASPAGV